MKTRFFFAALWLLPLLSPNSARAQSPYFPEDLVVNASALNLRDRPDKAGKVVEKLPRGAALSLLEVVNGGEYVEVDSNYGTWLKVRSKSKSGYVFSTYVTGAFNLYQDGDFFDQQPPALNWYGVYMRDSFSDELRKIEVHLEKVYSELAGDTVQVLASNQPEGSKFILSTAEPLRPGLAGNLGIYDAGAYYLTNELAPGAMLPIQPAQDYTDTVPITTYYLAATGCADFDESDGVRIDDYRLYVVEMQPDGPAIRQDISGWVRPEPGLNPSVSLFWYGDIDGDRKPDAVIQDAPMEVGARLSLFLSSKARPGELLHKVCEYFYQYD